MLDLRQLPPNSIRTTAAVVVEARMPTVRAGVAISSSLGIRHRKCNPVRLLPRQCNSNSNRVVEVVVDKRITPNNGLNTIG